MERQMPRKEMIALLVCTFVCGGLFAQGLTQLHRAAALVDDRPAPAERPAVIETGSAGPADALVAAARQALAEDRTNEAIELLERAIERDGTRAELHLWRGRAYARRAEQASAFKRAWFAGIARGAFTRTLELEPGNLAAHRALMEFYLEAPAVAGGSLERAVEQAEQIVRLDPDEGSRALALLTAAEDESAAGPPTSAH
jgi:tetratricopeptide (TPR) repeat protein